jgi:hypothetical protein
MHPPSLGNRRLRLIDFRRSITQETVRAKRRLAELERYPQPAVEPGR